MHKITKFIHRCSALQGLIVSILLLTSCQSPMQTDVSVARKVASNAGWSDSVGLEFKGEQMIVRSFGLPNHELLPIYQAISVLDNKTIYTIEPKEQALRIVIPLAPKMAAQKTSTDIGIIGIAISGGVIYSPYEADRTTIALDHNFELFGIPFIDQCNGHPNPFAVQYHYHGIPHCITKVIDRPGEHSHLFGYLFDGFPVYGPQGEGATLLTPADLDECNGHTEPTPEFPEGIYHYHMTEQSPYSATCYSGEVNLLPTAVRGLLQGVDFSPWIGSILSGLFALLALVAGIVWLR